MSNLTPWASFCMSTYNRPDFLKKQIELLLQQSFQDFEIVIADNDPNASGKAIAAEFNDSRIKYECNGENLGMVKSFNRAIDRAIGEFVVMITDDDPVFDNMLSFFYSLQTKYPNYSLYCGAKRKKTAYEAIEIIDKDDFPHQILDTKLTASLHWSGSLLRRRTLVEIGKLADFGSGHLVDHIMIVLMGSKDGAIIINREFSDTQLHQLNYSKTNFDNYSIGCTNFYNILTNTFKDRPNYKKNLAGILDHLHTWVIVCFFSLRNFFTIHQSSNKNIIKEIDVAAYKILDLPYMRVCKTKYELKKIIFFIKKQLGLLK